jgi:hypothetical protein
LNNGFVGGVIAPPEGTPAHLKGAEALRFELLQVIRQLGRFVH